MLNHQFLPLMGIQREFFSPELEAFILKFINGQPLDFQPETTGAEVYEMVEMVHRQSTVVDPEKVALDRSGPHSSLDRQHRQSPAEPVDLPTMAYSAF
jgi:hypothetical protein